MSLTQLIDAMAMRKTAFAEEIMLVKEERRRYDAAASELERQRERNGQELGGYLLPDLDDEDLLALERRLRYPALVAKKRETEAELARLEAEKLALEADAKYQQRDVARVDYDNQLAEIGEAAESFAAERAVWQGSKHFRFLHERGWFEPDYDGGLFDWLRDWRACSLLMADLEQGFCDKTFPEDEDVKAAWTAHFAASEPVLTLRKQLQDQLAELVALEARHAELVAAPDRLFQELWKALAQMIVEHLRAAPDDLRVALGQGDEALAAFLKKDVGLKKQAGYLREIIVQRIDPYWLCLSSEEQKIGQKVDKLRYKRSRGKWVQAGGVEIAKARDVPAEKWFTRRESFAKTRTRISEFDRWDRGSFVEDFLWWDFITRGARGDDLYEVRTFHQRHPGWSVDSFRDPLERDQVADANDLAASATVDHMLDADAAGVDVS